MGDHYIFEDAFTVDQPDGTRWRAALEFLESGEDIVVAGVGLRVERDTLLVTVTAWDPVAQMPEEVAGRDLRGAAKMVAELAESSEGFRRVVGTREVIVELVDRYQGWRLALLRGGEASFTEIWRRHRERGYETRVVPDRISTAGLGPSGRDAAFALHTVDCELPGNESNAWVRVTRTTAHTNATASP